MSSAIHIAFGNDCAGTDRLDWCSDWGCIVYSVVSTVTLQDRMEAGVTETGSNTEEVERCFQECLPQTVSFRIEIFKHAVLRKRDCSKGFSLMREDGCINRCNF